MNPQDLKWLTECRHALHRHPEISGEEKETAATISALLETCAPDRVVTGIGGHGVAAVYDSGNQGPTVAIRCELDGLPIQEIPGMPYTSAVPGKGHLCGHDGHMAMVLGVGRALSRRPLKTGSVALVFQPAEETGKGAIAYRNDPKFAKIAPDYAFSLHNLPGLDLGTVELCQGATNCASRGMRIKLTGKTSHAAAPQDGVSPALALSRLIPVMGELGQGGYLDDSYALTTVTHANLGEATFGVAPGQAALWVTLRTVTDKRMKDLINSAEDLVSEVARSEGLSIDIEYDDVFDACVNHAEAVEILSQACADQNVPLQLSQLPQRFSEDFGQFAKGAKSAMFWLGAGKDHPQLHNPDYDFPDALIPVGTGIFLAAIDQVLGSDKP